MKLLPLLSVLCVLSGAASAQWSTSPWQVSSQGRLSPDVPRDVRPSPRGTLTLALSRPRGDAHVLRHDVELRTSSGEPTLLRDVAGNGFFASDVGVAVVLDAHESNRVATKVTLYDLDGAQVARWSIAGLTNPALSSDGRYLAYGTASGLEVVDLATRQRRVSDPLRAFAIGAGGRLVGLDTAAPSVLVARDADGAEQRYELGLRPQQLAVTGDGARAYALTPSAVHEVDLVTSQIRAVHLAEPGQELRDLRVTAEGVVLGRYANQGSGATGSSLMIGTAGGFPGPTTTIPLPPPVVLPPLMPGNLPWPLSPSAPHAVGNTYGEFQEYGGAPYMHPGIDVLGFDGEPVYAVKGGVVKSILTTSGQYHWRIAIGAPGNGTTKGYLYAHVDQPTVTVNVGDVVTQGQYLGDLVPWPVASFTHCHFARIQDTGAQWSGDWLCTDNPQPEMVPQVDGTDPVFENAVGADLFAFCRNETSIYLDPAALDGAVDVIARVSDTVQSSWQCAVQELRYSIWPVGQPGQPLVDDRLAVRFEMALDTYQGGPIDPFLVGLLYKEDATCNTDGDYGSRDFYHVLTNSDGNSLYQPSDQDLAWETANLPDGDYVIEVTAWDASGNSATASMVVTTLNGNP